MLFDPILGQTPEPENIMRDETTIKYTRATILATIPPQALVLFAVVAIQFGAAISVNLFPVLGVEGTVAVRIILSAFIMLGFSSSGLKHLMVALKDHWKILLVFGMCIVAMNLFFYQAIDRIPLGAAVAIEFIGPLGVAAYNSKRLIHIFWVGLAAVGILLFSPLSGVNLNTAGIVFALLAGSGWALFIILAARLGDRIDGHDGLTIGMLIAALIMTPMAVPVVSDLILNPMVLIASIGVAVLSTAIPFTFEFEALKRLPARAYGVLVSMEPAVAATVGAILLGERIGTQGIIAVCCVVVAAIGISITDNQSPA